MLRRPSMAPSLQIMAVVEGTFLNDLKRWPLKVKRRVTATLPYLT